jgi:Uma2 family endonuclease
MEKVLKQKMTFEEFKEIEKNSDTQLEFIDGEIFFQASPSTAHQIILTNISTVFGNFFKNKKCKHVVSPYDVIFKNEHETLTHKTQPDISVLCNENGFKENFYEGVPTLIIEVLSPSTASKDFVKKMDLYMRFGVKEYWIVSPKNEEVQIFNLDGEVYGEPINYSGNEVVKSIIFEGLEFNLKDVF